MAHFNPNSFCNNVSVQNETFKKYSNIHSLVKPNVSLQQSSTRPGHLKSLCQPEQFVGFYLKMASMVESEASTKQKTIEKPCGICQGPQPAKRIDA